MSRSLLVILIVVFAIVGAFAADAIRLKRSYRVRCPSVLDGGTPAPLSVPMDGGTIAITPIDYMLAVPVDDAGVSGCVRIVSPLNAAQTPAADDLGPTIGRGCQAIALEMDGTDAYCVSTQGTQQLNVVTGVN